MVEIDIPIQASLEFKVTEAVEAAIAVLELKVTMDGTLKSFPGSRHWHLQKPKRTGTLEVTWWPSAKRLWVSYHGNREGNGWVKAAAADFAEAAALTLSSQSPTA